MSRERSAHPQASRSSRMSRALSSSGLPGASSGVDMSTLGADDSSASWGDRDGWTPTRFNRRYKPGPSIDELSEEIAKLQRQLSLPAATPGGRRKYSPRARINRTRIRR